MPGPAATRTSVGEVFEIIRRQNEWRAGTLNMIASENVLSPAALRAMSSDFVGRYAEGHPGARYYEGTRFIDEGDEKIAGSAAGVCPSKSFS